MNKGIEYAMNMSETFALTKVKQWTLSEYFKSYNEFLKWAYDWKELNLPGGMDPILKKYSKRKVIVSQSYLMKKHRCTLYIDAYFFCLYVMYRSGIRYFNNRHVKRLAVHYFYFCELDFKNAIIWAAIRKFKMYSRKLTDLECSTVPWAYEKRTGFSAIKTDRVIDPKINDLAISRGWDKLYPKDLRGIKLEPDYLFKNFLNKRMQ